jgi:hypothetical protein
LAADHHQISHQQSSDPPTTLSIIWNNSRKRADYSKFQGESDYQLYFSIGLMILWQNTKKHQNCVGGGGTLAADHHQFARH